jgi:hypothetical protein
MSSTNPFRRRKDQAIRLRGVCRKVGDLKFNDQREYKINLEVLFVVQWDLKCSVTKKSRRELKIPQSWISEASRSLTEASGAIFQQKNMRALRSAGRKSLLQEV